VKAESEGEIEGRSLAVAVSSSLVRLFGECGASLADLRLVDYQPESRCAIFRCNHKALDMARASMVALKGVDGEKTALRIVYVSGTLKALRKRLGQ
jgi:RNase P/RNase MRP subunit POP5